MGTRKCENETNPIESAGEPISRILFAAPRDRSRTATRRPFLWAAHCCATPAAYPRVDPPVPCETGVTGRTSPPLLFGLAPRGVYRAPDVAIGAVGSYPTVSPLPNASHDWRAARGFASRCPQVGGAGGLLSVALSVAPKEHSQEWLCHRSPLVLPGAPSCGVRTFLHPAEAGQRPSGSPATL